MDLRLFHSSQIFSEAVDDLIGSGTLPERLKAASARLAGITPDEFDAFPEIKQAYAHLKGFLSTHQDPRQGSHVASIEAMGATKRMGLARAFLEIDRAIRAAS